MDTVISSAYPPIPFEGAPVDMDALSSAPPNPREVDPPSTSAGNAGLRGSSVRGFLWGTAAWGSNRIVVLALTLFLARVLLPDDFGVVTAALTVIAILDAALALSRRPRPRPNQEPRRE